MKLGSCPKCGSRKVRTGKIYLLHLARLAPGSRRRYCRNCGARWIGSEAVFLPSARLAGILFLCVSAALALNYLKDDGWFGPQPRSLQAAGEVDSSGKRTLWDKYGGNFASEKDAKAAYDDFQRHRSELPK